MLPLVSQAEGGGERVNSYYKNMLEAKAVESAKKAEEAQSFVEQNTQENEEES
ncbi:hypothetical protein HBR94_04165 [Pseudomonas sp. WS 5412]|uniref:hypothetical protein n=1 Tax=Pseudomonas sp. WS 5412 TaxID=2717487 RepID=UPI0014750BE8|nr:hypothetical protein [Pseudomonas sp. WS 5412]NMY30697.1 hypothetical protein [Pseudomonas sp. WS 5412]